MNTSNAKATVADRAARPVALPTAVIFDWDNTLVDSWPAIAESINWVRAKYGLPVWDMDGIMANCTRSARDLFPEWFGDRWEAAWQDYYAFFGEARVRIGLRPLPGSEALLQFLQAQNIPALVVSNKSASFLTLEADELGWTQYFKAMTGAGVAARDKPARDHADHALHAAGLVGNPDIWFVGDTEADAKCAANADCTFILVGDKDGIGKWDANQSFTDCEALLALMREISLSKG